MRILLAIVALAALAMVLVVPEPDVHELVPVEQVEQVELLQETTLEDMREPVVIPVEPTPDADYIAWATATNNEVRWTPEVQASWPTCRRIQEVKTFILDYQVRARTSPNLITNLVIELDPYRAWMDETFGQDEEIWRLITSYQNEVDDTIRNYGDDADMRDDEPSRWPLFRALTAASRPYYEALTDEDTPTPIPLPGSGQERSRCGG